MESVTSVHQALLVDKGGLCSITFGVVLYRLEILEIVIDFSSKFTSHNLKERTITKRYGGGGVGEVQKIIMQGKI